MTIDDLPAPYVPMSQDLITVRRVALLEEIKRDRPASSGRRGLTRLAAAAAVVLAGGAWLSISWFSGLTSAYASWTPIPQRLAAAVVHGQAAMCMSRLARMGEAPDTSVMRPVLAERRGSFTAVLVGGPSVVGVCLNGSATWMTGYTQSPALAPGAQLSLTGNGGKTNAPDAARYVYGRAAPDVAAIAVTTADGRTITATVSSGYFFAWWPSGAGPRHLTATSRSGAHVASLTPPPVPAP